MPTVGDVDIDPDPNFLDSSNVCSARYETTAPADEVITHYERHLSATGWNVAIDSPAKLASERGCEPGGVDCQEYAGLTAVERPMCLDVTTEHYPGGDPPERKAVYLAARRC